jgi:hypothetical protein
MAIQGSQMPAHSPQMTVSRGVVSMCIGIRLNVYRDLFQCVTEILIQKKGHLPNHSLSKPDRIPSKGSGIKSVGRNLSKTFLFRETNGYADEDVPFQIST